MNKLSRLFILPLALLALVIGFGCGNSATPGETAKEGLSFFIGQNSNKLSTRLKEHGFTPSVVNMASEPGQLVQALIGAKSDDFLVVVNPHLNKAITTAVITDDAQWSQVEQLLENLEKLNTNGPKQLSRLKPSTQGKARIAVFSDFQCPFCKKIEGVLQGWEKKFGPDLEIEFVNFPLPSHPLAQVAAVAETCAGEQGKGDAYRAKLFDKQESMKNGQKPFFEIARALGLDGGKFNSCLASKDTLEAVQNEVFLGNYMAVKGTPTLFLNGEPLDNSTVPEVEEKIKKALGR